jgi:hypothetical protein
MKKILLAMFMLGPMVQAQSEPLNVLFLLTDNQPASIIGAYGNPDVPTLNIDQLATEDLQFNNAFAENGMCSPTRATLMTGLMPSQHGVHNWLDDEEMHQWPRDWSAVAYSVSGSLKPLRSATIASVISAVNSSTLACGLRLSNRRVTSGLE